MSLHAMHVHHFASGRLDTYFPGLGGLGLFQKVPSCPAGSAMVLLHTVDNIDKFIDNSIQMIIS